MSETPEEVVCPGCPGCDLDAEFVDIKARMESLRIALNLGKKDVEAINLAENFSDFVLYGKVPEATVLEMVASKRGRIDPELPEA